MKSIYSKILALILIMSSLISMFTIFATAEEADGTGSGNGENKEDSVALMYYRTFDDGLEALKGASPNIKEQTEFVVDEGQTDEGRINKFMRMIFGVTSSGSHDYIDIAGANRSEVGSVFEFDIMTEEDSTNAANPVCIQTKGGSASAVTPINLFTIKDNKVSFLENKYTNVFTMESEVWYRIQVIFDYTSASQIENSISETFNVIVK